MCWPIEHTITSSRCHLLQLGSIERQKVMFASAITGCDVFDCAQEAGKRGVQFKGQGKPGQSVKSLKKGGSTVASRKQGKKVCGLLPLPCCCRWAAAC
jgi:hypothetical protein